MSKLRKLTILDKKPLKYIRNLIYLFFVFIISDLILSGCSLESAMRFGWPAAITAEGQTLLDFWRIAVCIALAVGILMYSLMFWVVTVYRKKADDREFPRQTQYNIFLEIVYTIIPVVIVLVLCAFTYSAQVKALAKKDPDIIVDVTAMQWNWKFGYRYIKDGPLGGEYRGGTSSPYSANLEEAKKNAQGSPIIRGINPKDRYYLKYNKIETIGTPHKIPVLVLPVNTRISFVLASADVIHSFWVVAFGEKRDVFPFPKENGQDNEMQITGIKNLGAYVGHCTEMCGVYHSMMNFEVRAVSKADFKKYMLARISGKTDAQALIAIGLPPAAVTTTPLDQRIPGN